MGAILGKLGKLGRYGEFWHNIERIYQAQTKINNKNNCKIIQNLANNPKKIKNHIKVNYNFSNKTTYQTNYQTNRQYDEKVDVSFDNLYNFYFLVLSY